MNLAQTIEKLKEGCIAQRDGWNGKGMYIFIRPADTISPNIIANIRSLPAIVKEHLIFKGQPVKFNSYLCMYNAKGEIVNGWLASQEDILADDWNVISKIV
jgi:hypothetical protein